MFFATFFIACYPSALSGGAKRRKITSALYMHRVRRSASRSKNENDDGERGKSLTARHHIDRL